MISKEIKSGDKVNLDMNIFDPHENKISNQLKTDLGETQTRSAYTLRIDGIEATQVTQFYRSHKHLDPPYDEPDHSVPLIRGKPLVLRIYPSLSGWLDFSINPTSDGSSQGSFGIVTDSIASSGTAADTALYPKYIDGFLGYISPQGYPIAAQKLNGPIEGRVFSTINRGDLDQTLNFRLSSDVTQAASVYVIAKIWTVDSAWELTSDLVGGRLDFKYVPPLRIRAYGVNYMVGGTTYEAPLLNDFIDTAAFASKIFPIASIDWISYDTIDFNSQEGDLTDDTGECGSGWTALIYRLYDLYVTTPDATYHGLVNQAAPHNKSGCGAGDGHSSACIDGCQTTMAHELGHAIGRAHAPCCDADNTDPDYPDYNDNICSIGEYGFDPNDISVKDPEIYHDFMGYCTPKWVSPYNYRALIQKITNQPNNISFFGGKRFQTNEHHTKREYLHLTIKFNEDKKAEILHGLTVTGYDLNANLEDTESTAALLDKDNRVLYVKRLKVDRMSESHTIRNNARLSVSIPWYDGARKLKFNYDSKWVKEDIETVVRIPANKLSVNVISFKKDQEKLSLEWKINSDISDTRSIIRYSNDDGAQWRPLTVIKQTIYQIDLNKLAGGEKCKFQIIASNNLQTSTTETEIFSVDKQVRTARIRIIKNRNGQVETNSIELVGSVSSPDSIAKAEDLVWTLIGENMVYYGSYVNMNNLSVGEHLISLCAPDGLGGQARTEIRVCIPKH